MKPFHYRYNVITRADADMDVSEQLWKANPDMLYLVRTSVRIPSNVESSNRWVSGMGDTVEAAVRSAEMGLRFFYGQRRYVGRVTSHPIKNDDTTKMRIPSWSEKR